MTTVSTATTQSTKSVEWQIDPAHSAAHFSVRHLMISNVRGEFSALTGSAVINQTDPAKSSVEVTIETASINTREPKRDEHLRSPDFFDVATYPAITFRSTRIQGLAPDHFKVTGELTIHGVTKEVTLEVEGPTASVKDPWGNVRAGIAATTKINRKDFGLAWDALTEAGGAIVGDEIKITIEAELIEKVAAA